VLHRMRYGVFMMLLLVVGLAACAGPTVESGSTVVSPQPSRPPNSLPAGDTPTAIPVPAAPATLVPSDTPTTKPSSTPTALPPTASPTAGLAAPLDSIILELQPIVGGLDTPVGIANAGDGSGRLFVLEKVGRIRVVQGGVLASVPFLDITSRVGSSSNEQGLLGLVFHPDYANNGFFFINYTDRQGDTVVARYKVSADPAQADPASETTVLTIDQPAANHNGGGLVFGPDGYLWVGTGDGGGAGDRFGNGQKGQTLLGKMLRLDVDDGQPYTIPRDNPFVADPNVRDEIWAIGMRNPWRYSFDRLTGDLYIADVGQGQYEEVDFQPAGDPGGQNYGWPIMEGLHCYPESRSCDQAGLTLPVFEYDHSQGCSITGGYVYRGQEFLFLTGVYLFGDYCSGRIGGLIRASSGQGAWQGSWLSQADVQLSSFGEDEAGELYLVDMGRGDLFKVSAKLK